MYILCAQQSSSRIIAYYIAYYIDTYMQCSNHFVAMLVHWHNNNNNNGYREHRKKNCINCSPTKRKWNKSNDNRIQEREEKKIEQSADVSKK